MKMGKREVPGGPQKITKTKKRSEKGTRTLLS